MTCSIEAQLNQALMDAEDAYGAAVKHSMAMEAKLRKARGNFALHHRNYAEAARADERALAAVDAARSALTLFQANGRQRAFNERRAAEKAAQPELF